MSWRCLGNAASCPEIRGLAERSPIIDLGTLLHRGVGTLCEGLAVRGEGESVMMLMLIYVGVREYNGSKNLGKGE